MSYLSETTAIFSPSIARLAASAAKDWSYIDSWLAVKFHGRAGPSFERNPETLKALLALVTVNEAADEDRDLVLRLNAIALQELNAATDRGYADEPVDATSVDRRAPQTDILITLGSALTGEGKIGLDTLTSVTVDAGLAHPDPEGIGRWVIDLHAEMCDLEQVTERFTAVQRLIVSEAEKLDTVIRELQGDGYRPSSDLAKHNLDVQRRLKSMTSRVPEVKDKVSGGASYVSQPQHRVEQVKVEEDEYLTLVALKKQLRAMVGAFEGLPPDSQLARQKLEDLRAGLRSITWRRDAVFEGLVEQESPYKRR
ncbi:hypothetical protein NKR23_g9914 [Pleurostoma richardsiae]|uniref:Uncharacterized protein n=1 Tax=Pleurostoma richardsiae TaxID=41990 RepID=A0AA38VJ02_9PEZI|nr:hypothetical protein NKR23_g9914 [Pleurostoma richardsiae]